jgi:hypothetical protein
MKEWNLAKISFRSKGQYLWKIHVYASMPLASCLDLMCMWQTLYGFLSHLLTYSNAFDVQEVVPQSPWRDTVPQAACGF